MEFRDFKELVGGITVGKQLPDAVYLHESAIDALPEKLGKLTSSIAKALNIQPDEWNVIKFYKRDFKLALLHYPDFDNYCYPALKTSHTIDLQKLSMRKADYGKSDNPPILHRKETLVKNDYPLTGDFKAATEEGEAIGLYDHVRNIGFKRSWERLISQKGYFLDESGRLRPKVDRTLYVESDIEPTNGKIDRHLTAIDRNQLSQPMQIVARHNYFDGEYSVLDYGCGKGDDVRELEAHGIDVCGWDPIHNPEGALVNSDIVNLGFVLNVIENREERDETLKRAWEHADKFLVASVMIAGESLISQFKPYKDGVITSRNTFQRYYTQSEFRSYLETILSESAIAVGQGIFFVFKDKIEEQSFLLERQHIKRDWTQRTKRERTNSSRAITKDIIEKNQELFDDFWDTTLDLGRIPANSEFDLSDQIRRIAGSHKKAYEALIKKNGPALFDEAMQARRNDLTVYFALGLFEKRKPYNQMPESLKRDIKAFFNTHNLAIDYAKTMLFSLGDADLIEAAATGAYRQFPVGEFNEGHSWVIPKELLSQLPAELRIYVGCATQLFGDLSEIQLIKIHFTSGKVSLMRYENWDGEIPRLIERIKIKLREQDVDFFDYTGRFEPTPLLNKNRFLIKNLSHS